MHALKELKYRLIHKYRMGIIVLHIGKWVLKLFSPYANIRMVLEWHANQQAQQDPVWKNVVLPLRRIPFGFLMLRGRQAGEEDLPFIENFILQKLDMISQNSIWVNAIKAVDSTILKILEKHGLQEKKSKLLISKLQSFKVPCSSSHGDFHFNNVVFINGKIYIIDWSLYSSKSSIILDIMHLSLRQICNKNSISWAEAQLKVIPMWDILADKINVDVNNLRILYAVDRTERELRQKGTTYDYKNISKYISALDNVIKKLEEVYG
jgi:hypothetical protein